MSDLPFKCYETFRDGYIAFERRGRFYFGPIAKLSAFLSGSSESFISDDAAEAKVAELHERQDNRCYSKPHPDSDTELAAARERWEHERRSGQWEKESE
jgi:hypothetical protein